MLQVVTLTAVFPKGRVSDQLTEAEKTASCAKALWRGARLCLSHAEKLSTDSALLCFSGLRPARTLTLPLVGTMHLALGTETGELLSNTT